MGIGKLDIVKVGVEDISLGKMWWSLKRPILLAERKDTEE